MKQIGFIDYYLGEWHANHYPAWIAAACEEAGLDYRVGYAWAEKDVSPVTGETSDEWCARMGVTRCASAEELCEKSDVILILAPSDPQKHLSYARIALRFGKPTYIDKTFAVDETEARQIFSVAAEHSAPVFTSSALRYAAELQEAPSLASLTVTGGGRRFDEYLIHLTEQAAMLLNDPVQTARVTRQGNQRLCRLTTARGKECTLVFAEKLPYAVSGETEEGNAWGKTLTSDFFRGLIGAILRFYETGVPPVSREETLEVMRMRDLILQADASAD